MADLRAWYHYSFLFLCDLPGDKRKMELAYFYAGNYCWPALIAAIGLAGGKCIPGNGSFSCRWLLCTGKPETDADQCKKSMEPAAIVLAYRIVITFYQSKQ